MASSFGVSARFMLVFTFCNVSQVLTSSTRGGSAVWTEAVHWPGERVQKSRNPGGGFAARTEDALCSATRAGSECTSSDVQPCVTPMTDATTSTRTKLIAFIPRNAEGRYEPHP